MSILCDLQFLGCLIVLAPRSISNSWHFLDWSESAGHFPNLGQLRKRVGERRQSIWGFTDWTEVGINPLAGRAHVMHQVVPQRSTQLRRRAHAVHPRGGAARPETPVSCNSLIPLRSCPPRPAP